MKRVFGLSIAIFIFLSLCSCEIIRKPLDNRVGFSKHLQKVEDSIRAEDWINAQRSLESAAVAWRKLKPALQVDIDHDYVNSIENNFTGLKAYIETKEKPQSLATILKIQEDWKNIGSM